MGEEADELRRTLRDLLGLLGLPAVWRGRSPAQVLTSFSEALEAIVNVDVVFITASRLQPPIRLVRIHGVEAPTRLPEAREWFAELASASSSTQGEARCGELGTLRVVCEPADYYAAAGTIILASKRPDFPSTAELAIIRAGIALTSSALETARALAEKEEALRSREEFMAILGHELRNPLAPITTAIELIRARQHGQLEREEQIIERQVVHLTRLVDDLLDIARITRGTIELKRSRVELAEVVDAAVEASATLYETRGHELSVDVPRTGLVIDGDRFRLVQVIVNLLTNAGRYTPDGGQVHVAAREVEGRAILSIRDTGIGMTEALLTRVFEPFVQGRRSSDAEHGGLGIGLALVRTLVTLHGGEVAATSDGPEQGSQFEVSLPLASKAVVALPDPSGPGVAPPSSRRRRILIVDDNADSGEMLGAFLEMEGHEVQVLFDPFAAVATVQTFDPHIAILDIGMPGRNGFEVAADIRERFGDDAPELIAITGYGQPSDRAKTTSAGFAAHFVKPVELKSLVAYLNDDG